MGEHLPRDAEFLLCSICPRSRALKRCSGSAEVEQAQRCSFIRGKHHLQVINWGLAPNDAQTNEIGRAGNGVPALIPAWSCARANSACGRVKKQDWQSELGVVFPVKGAQGRRCLCHLPVSLELAHPCLSTMLTGMAWNRCTSRAGIPAAPEETAPFLL